MDVPERLRLIAPCACLLRRRWIVFNEIFGTLIDDLVGHLMEVMYPEHRAIQSGVSRSTYAPPSCSSSLTFPEL